MQNRLFNRAQYETFDVAQTLMESISERDGSDRRRCGMVPWGKKILLEKMDGKVWRGENMFKGRSSGELIVFG